MTIANLKVLRQVISLHSLCHFLLKFFWMNFIGTHNIFLHFFEENAPFFRKIFHLRIHAEFSKPRDTFQNEENEGCIFDSKTRNGPNRGMFITVMFFSCFIKISSSLDYPPPMNFHTCFRNNS